MVSTYDEVIQFLYRQTQSDNSQIGEKFDLKRIKALFASHACLDEEAFRVIHIAGTNGKGSVSHMIASVLYESGYKVGLYTSPHLTDIKERFQVNGKLISEKEFLEVFYELNRENILARVHPSFFEISFWMAYHYFEKKQVDWAVIETGLGGRLDATNVIVPSLSVITNVGYDHQDVLGETLQEIANEKAGIIKENVPIVVGEYQEEVSEVFERVALEKKARIHYASKTIRSVSKLIEKGEIAYEVSFKGENKVTHVQTPLLGRYQVNNVATVYQAGLVLDDCKLASIPLSSLKRGIERVQHNFTLRGRWEIGYKSPCVILDVAHNRDGLECVVSQAIELAKLEQKSLAIVYGCLASKNLDTILPILPKEATYYFTRADTKRAMPLDLLYEAVLQYGLKGKMYPAVCQALRSALGNEKGIVLVVGSFFIVGEALGYLSGIKGGQVK